MDGHPQRRRAGRVVAQPQAVGRSEIDRHVAARGRSRRRSVKFASETSKKMLPTASTLTRALVVVGRFGTTMLSEPSFGVFATSVIGNVRPPLVESEILTVGRQRIGAVDAPRDRLGRTAGQVTALLGDTTANGPAPAIDGDLRSRPWRCRHPRRGCRAPSPRTPSSGPATAALRPSDSCASSSRRRSAAAHSRSSRM